MIGGRVFVRGIALHHTAPYLARLGGRIQSLRAFRRAEPRRTGKTKCKKKKNRKNNTNTKKKQSKTNNDNINYDSIAPRIPPGRVEE